MTPDDARGMFSAWFNQIPDTMVASQAILQRFLALRPVGGDDGDQGGKEVDRFLSLHKLVTEWIATTAVNTITLENRIERLEGRPGIPDDSLDAIMSEFRGMGG
ncbi:hypothetical protein EUA02_26885 [Mycobacterium paragordonae]|nr:hypothetical protein [Mycobacterium paragordonae]TDK87554.1 hypothetical protein EUA02_26885 [Mycobacterium paragordonae]TDL01115.1 hypothetical protein EUA05_28570 [Mycobacterium paragordonae]